MGRAGTSSLFIVVGVVLCLVGDARSAVAHNQRRVVKTNYVPSRALRQTDYYQTLFQLSTPPYYSNPQVVTPAANPYTQPNPYEDSTPMTLEEYLLASFPTSHYYNTPTDNSPLPSQYNYNSDIGTYLTGLPSGKYEYPAPTYENNALQDTPTYILPTNYKKELSQPVFPEEYVVPVSPPTTHSSYSKEHDALRDIFKCLIEKVKTLNNILEGDQYGEGRAGDQKSHGQGHQHGGLMGRASSNALNSPYDFYLGVHSPYTTESGAFTPMNYPTNYLPQYSTYQVSSLTPSSGAFNARVSKPNVIYPASYSGAVDLTPLIPVDQVYIPPLDVFSNDQLRGRFNYHPHLHHQTPGKISDILSAITAAQLGHDYASDNYTYSGGEIVEPTLEEIEEYKKINELVSLHHSSQISERTFDISSLVGLVEKLLSSIPKFLGEDSSHQGDGNKEVVYHAPPASVVAYIPPISDVTQKAQKGTIDGRQGGKSEGQGHHEMHGRASFDPMNSPYDAYAMVHNPYVSDSGAVSFNGNYYPTKFTTSPYTFYAPSASSNYNYAAPDNSFL